jgi:parvulin-like peptidyl-prolyl isomerase
MIASTLLAVVLGAAPAKDQAPSARVFLKASASTAACRASKVDDQLVRVPLFAVESEDCPVAKVGDETIALRELASAVEFAHVKRSPMTPAPAKRPDMDFTPALDRLITTRLLVLEAREMQIDQAPEYRRELEEFKAARLRGMVQAVAVRGVKPDAAEVERLYRDAVREWKVASVLLDKEEDAKALRAALAGGGDFVALAKKATAEKKGRGDGKAQFVSRKHMLPEILAAVRDAKQGAVVGPLKLQAGWVVLRVEGVRYPKDPAAREAAKASSVARLEREAVRRFYLDLVKRTAVVDEALLKGLDFEVGGEQGFEALAKDERPLAKIQGEKPVTVGDLTREIGLKFFHGLKSPIEQKRVNVYKPEAFERLLGQRLFAREAAARKLADRPDYRREVAEYERAYAFNTFIEKVVAPDVKVTEKDAIEYYEQHKADYTAPEMFKLDGFAFTSGRDAQVALDKLKQGTDWTWLRSTATGQVEPERRTLQFDGRTVSAGALPPALAKALAGARAGDLRLYAASDAEVYVVKVLEYAPSVVQPYADAREGIAKSLFDRQLERAIGEYAAKLRKAQRVDVLITRIAM